MTIRFSVTSAGFGWLSQAFPQSTPISPFSLFGKARGAAHDDEVVKELITADVVEQDGTIKPGALPALQLLSETQSYSRIRILGTLAPVDKITYFGEGAPCAVDAGPGSLEVTYPAMNKEAGYIIEEYTGSSRMVNVPFTATMPPLHASAFLSLVDLVRYSSLLALAKRSGAMFFTAEEVLQEMVSQRTYMSLNRTLAGLVQENALTAERERVSLALEALVERGYALSRDGKYSLCGDALELATSFLVPEYVFNLSFGRMISSDAVEQSECFIVFCGMHNLLYVDPTGKDVTIETLSGSDALGMLLHALNQGPLT